MIQNLIHVLKKLDVKELIGIPDSVLAEILHEISKDNFFKISVPSNEGSSVAEYFGNYLATGHTYRAIVFAQNAGLGNMVNPLTSLVDSNVYQIPFILLLGLRGDIEDEPQHLSMGNITRPILELLKFEIFELDENTNLADLEDLINKAFLTKSRLALVVRRKVFKSVQFTYPDSPSTLTRKQVISKYVSNFGDSCMYFGSTGMIGRELYEIAEDKKIQSKVLITPGSMGHFSSLIKGFKKIHPNVPTIAFEGDGSVLMHLGNFVDFLESKAQSHIHVILNNKCHASVGGLNTFLQSQSVTDALKFELDAKILRNTAEVEEEIKRFSLGDSVVHEILVTPGNEIKIGRPKISFNEQIKQFRDSFQ